MPFYLFRHRFALTLGLAAITTVAEAATDTGTLGITVEVQDVCSVDGSTLDFGAYSSGQASTLEATGSVRYNGCSAGDLSFSLDGGQSGDEAARTLSNDSGDTLTYQLFRDSNRTQIWGTGANAMTWRLVVAGSGEIPVYGSIAGGQSAAAGVYTDTINVTLTF